MSLSKNEWKAGITEESKPMGCMGCLFLVLACLALDGLTVFLGYKIVMLVGDVIAG
jgi:hypothetical protein